MREGGREGENNDCEEMCTLFAKMNNVVTYIFVACH